MVGNYELHSLLPLPRATTRLTCNRVSEERIQIPARSPCSIFRKTLILGQLGYGTYRADSDCSGRSA